MSLFPRFSPQAEGPIPANFEQRAEKVADRMRACFDAAALKAGDVSTIPRNTVPSNAGGEYRSDAPNVDQVRNGAAATLPGKPSGRVVAEYNTDPINFVPPSSLPRAAFLRHRRFTAAPTGRGFLFLQGSATRFFERLGRALAERGHSVHRVNFNGGDRAFWRLPGAVDFCGRADEWPDFLDHLVVENAVSDIILFDDCRPLHRAAIRVAEARLLRIHVVDEGYLRPDWITFEEGGVKGHSALPRDPSWYLERARSLPAWRDPPSVPGSFRRRAFEDVIYTMASMAGMWRFPHYAKHRPYHQLIEYAGWLRRLALKRRAERRAAATIESLSHSSEPLFLFLLQLDADYQVRVHSPFRAMHLAIEHVLGSFAKHAPSTTHLVVKLHPLDSGLVDWAAMTEYLAVELGIADRVSIIDGGDLGKLFERKPALVTINSAVATLALAYGLPVIALGRAVYDIAGLTFQQELDEFWKAPTPPDVALFDAFRRVLAARCLIPGSFFNEAGLTLAVNAAVQRLEATYARPAWAHADNLAQDGVTVASRRWGRIIGLVSGHR